MEEKEEKVVEETTQETTEQVDESKFESAGDDSVIKVDLNKPPTPKEEKNEEPEKNTEVEADSTDDSGVVAESENADAPQEQKEIQPEGETQETPVLEEITEEEVKEEVEEIADVTEEAIKENLETGKPLPDNIQKLMDFMEETGGDLNHYVKLNQDYSKLEDQDLLYEYYKQTKPHLNQEEINFLMEDQFSFDEDVDEDRDIRRNNRRRARAY